MLLCFCCTDHVVLTIIHTKNKLVYLHPGINERCSRQGGIDDVANAAKILMERWQSGRMRRSRKPLSRGLGTGGSNPPLSAFACHSSASAERRRVFIYGELRPSVVEVDLWPTKTAGTVVTPTPALPSRKKGSSNARPWCRPLGVTCGQTDDSNKRISIFDS